MKAATAVALTNGRAHKEWQKKIKNMQACTRLWCYITANFYQAETSVQVGQSLLSFEFYIKAGVRRDYKRGRYWNNSFGKRKENKKNPLIILLPVLTSSIPVSVLKLRFSLSCDTHRLGKDCQVCINGYRSVRTMIIGVHHNQHSGHKQSWKHENQRMAQLSK